MGAGAECTVCLEASKYTCPRCKEPYCSVDCYKEHGTVCTEGFFEEHMKANLSATKAGPEEKKRLEKVLFDLNNLEQEEDEEAFEIARWQELAAKEDLDLEDLTEEERKLFMDAMKNNEIPFESWKAWWESIEVDDFPDPEHICCGASHANPEIAWTMAEVVFDYCTFLRRFDGDRDSLSGFKKHCPVWSLKHRPVAEPSAFCSYVTQTRGPVASDLILPCLWDTAHVVKTPAFMMRVLTEIRDLLGEKWKRKVDFLSSFCIHHSSIMAAISPGIEDWVRQQAESKEEVKEREKLRRAPEKDGVKLPL